MRIDTHYLGGGRHFGSWEVADVGIIVQFRQAGTLVRSKIGLLQSKRLYPTEQEYEEDKPIDYLIGFGRLYEDTGSFLQVTHPRTFSFSRLSQYKALVVAGRQWDTIHQYEKSHGIPVHYLLYHPLRIPFTTRVPRSSNRAPRGPLRGGCPGGSGVVPTNRADKSDGRACPMLWRSGVSIAPPIRCTSHRSGMAFGGIHHRIAHHL